MPKPSTPDVARNRRARFDALVSGEWLCADAARLGRSPEQMRDVLAERVGMSRPEPEAKDDLHPCPTFSHTSDGGLPRAIATFTGAALSTALEPLQDESASGVPGNTRARDRVVAYLLWRFCSASLRQIATALGRRLEEVRRMVECVRQQRTTVAAWAVTLWRLEWRLRWRLASGPHRD
jgi:hypothetical protein